MHAQLALPTVATLAMASSTMVVQEATSPFQAFYEQCLANQHTRPYKQRLAMLSRTYKQHVVINQLNYQSSSCRGIMTKIRFGSLRLYRRSLPGGLVNQVQPINQAVKRARTSVESVAPRRSATSFEQSQYLAVQGIR